VKDIGAALIPILAAFVSARLVTRQMDPAEQRRRAAEEALAALAKANNEWLSGPKANSANYDPENPGKAGRYLFFQRNGKGIRGQFIPLKPLDEGILEIRVQAQTLKLLGVQPGPDGWGPHIAKVVDQTRKDVLATVDRLGLKPVVEQIYPVEEKEGRESEAEKSAADFDAKVGRSKPEKSDPSLALVIDFDELHMKPAQYRAGLIACGQAAYEAVRKGAGTSA
jgi:hypothetical protein